MEILIDPLFPERKEKPKEANWLRHLPYCTVVPKDGYSWEPYVRQLDEVELVNHYGNPISQNDRVLVGDDFADSLIFGSHWGYSVSIPWPYDVQVNAEVSSKEVTVPLWKLFLDLGSDPDKILGFALQYGKLGRSREMLIERNGTHVLVETTDTLNFWKDEIARLKLIDELKTLGKRGTLEDVGKLRGYFLEGETESLPGSFEKAFFLKPPAEQGFPSLERCLSKSYDLELWSLAEGGKGFFPEKLALAFADKLLKEALKEFPVVVAVELDGWEPYPVLKPSCLLSAILLSYMLILSGQMQYVFCAYCGKMGPLEAMVCRKTGEFIHKIEYPLFWKRGKRELKKQEAIRQALEAGKPLPKRGRPRKPLLQS